MRVQIKNVWPQRILQWVSYEFGTIVDADEKEVGVRLDIESDLVRYFGWENVIPAVEPGKLERALGGMPVRFKDIAPSPSLRI